MWNDEHDRELVERTLKGDRNAFGSLVEQYQRPVYNAAYKILGNPMDAEDAAQTAFVKAFEQLGSYRPEYRFFSWLYRITINESLNLRKARRHADDVNDVEVPANQPADKSLHEAELEDRVGKALMYLTPEDRALILLRHYQEMSYQDLAFVFEVPEKTIKSRLFTARTRLRTECETRGIRIEA